MHERNLHGSSQLNLVHFFLVIYEIKIIYESGGPGIADEAQHKPNSLEYHRGHRPSHSLRL